MQVETYLRNFVFFAFGSAVADQSRGIMFSSRNTLNAALFSNCAISPSLTFSWKSRVPIGIDALTTSETCSCIRSIMDPSTNNCILLAICVAIRQHNIVKQFTYRQFESSTMERIECRCTTENMRLGIFGIKLVVPYLQERYWN